MAFGSKVECRVGFITLVGVMLNDRKGKDVCSDHRGEILALSNNQFVSRRKRLSLFECVYTMSFSDMSDTYALFFNNQFRAHYKYTYIVFICRIKH